MLDISTTYIIIYFIVSAILGHKLLHHVIKTPAQYHRPSQDEGWIDAVVR